MRSPRRVEREFYLFVAQRTKLFCEVAKTYADFPPSAHRVASRAKGIWFRDGTRVQRLMRTSVIIPTYCRPEMLLNCVASILAGVRQPDEIVVVGRKGDTSTESVIAEIVSARYPSVAVRSAWVTEPGHVPPVETGVRLAQGDLVAIVDDDVIVTRSGYLR